MTDTLKITVSKNAAQEFTHFLKEKNLKVIEQRALPGVPMNAQWVVELIKVSPDLGILALFLLSWVAIRKNRSANLTFKDGKLISLKAEGHTTEEVEKLLGAAKRLDLIDKE